LPSSAAPPRNAVIAGIGFMLFGIFMFSLNDVMGKWLVATYSVGQVLLIRSAAALLILVPLAWRGGTAALRAVPHPGLQLVRIALSTAEVVCFYVAVIYLPLADVMTFYLAAPLYVAGLAALMLGERLDARRVGAVVLGFIGVLITLRPSAASLGAPALIALAGSIIFAFLMIVTRRLRGTSDTTPVLGQTLGAFLYGLVAAPLAWTPPSAVDLGLLSLLGVVAMAAHICVTRSLKLAPASAVTPYQYTLLVWAIVFGYLVFGDVPQPSMLLGSAVIVASGLFLLFAERRNAAGRPSEALANL
jgi:drug/metabolite transporter (DMT)-like permease